LPTGDRKAESTGSRRPTRRFLTGAAFDGPPGRLIPACIRISRTALLMVAISLAGAVTHGFAEDVPTPRISPLKLQAEGGADPTGSGDYVEPGPNDPVDTALIPPSTGDDQQPLEFLPSDRTNQADFPAADQLNAPLDLTPDPNAQGPIDLGAVQPVEPFSEPASADSGVLGTFTLDARMTDNGPPIPSGVVWRVFGSQADTDGKLPLVGQAEGGSVTLRLHPGDYMVNAAYGRAGLSKKVTVTDTAASETMVLNAGGMRLSALVGEDQTLPPGDVRFDIYASDDSGPGERALVLGDAPASAVISLNAGIYHVVCHYGDANAVVRADIRVQPGKLTEAVLYQKAARMTLKLVEEHGGEALANTAWTVVTPAGESVVESVGAFQSVVLAAGDYTAIAKHGDRTFERKFTVEAGLNRDVEVLIQ
jgi:hypothetical protein